MNEAADLRRRWIEDELVVLSAIYFGASFSAGDDERDECRIIADCFGRSPSSVDRQWRNMDAVLKGKPGNIGTLVRETVLNYSRHPAAYRQLALQICSTHAWPLHGLIANGHLAEEDVPIREEADTAIGEAIHRLCSRLQFTVFPAGSEGFECLGTILYEGVKYDARIAATLASCKNGSTHAKAKVPDLTEALRDVVMSAESTTFRTGRKGYFGRGRVVVNQETYVVTVRAIHKGESQ